MGERLKERITYDGNGNIQKYLRNSIDPTQLRMDSLNYRYYAGTNQLLRITDSIGANGYNDPEGRIVDLDGQLDSNYVYDSIGNLIQDRKENIASIKWNVYGKIQEITKNDAGVITTIKYTYDALGNRISQTVIPPAGGDRVVTWYVRDAQGNIMSTYKAVGNDNDLENLTLIQSEKYLYGSSRLGLVTVDDPDVDDGPGYMQNYYQRSSLGYDRGFKQYELTNHLGNVLATVSDRKFGVSSGSSSLIDHYEPDIVTAQDYYPFGMMSRVALPNSGRTYKFGFNGKMNDDEVKGGLGNQQDYGMRIYDPRVGRFLSVDPITKQYPDLTPYQFASNSPIENVDLDGFERFNYRLILSKDGKTVVGIQQDKVIKSWVDDFIHGQRHRVLDPNTKWLMEFEFKNKSELSKFVVNKPVEYLKEASALLYEEKVFVAVTTVAALELEGELARAGLRVPQTEGDVPPPVNAKAKALNSQNVAPKARAKFDQKSKGDLTWGSETLDDAIRTTEQAYEGFSTAKALNSANLPIKSSSTLTHAGRAVTKHPQYFGFESIEDLTKVYRSPEALNKLASSTIQNILENGVKTTGAGGRYPNGWVTYSLPNGNGASWNADGTFIGFRGAKK
jgi:RHS repeat-associated protein